MERTSGSKHYTKLHDEKAPGDVRLHQKDSYVSSTKTRVVQLQGALIWNSCYFDHKCRVLISQGHTKQVFRHEQTRVVSVLWKKCCRAKLCATAYKKYREATLPKKDESYYDYYW